MSLFPKNAAEYLVQQGIPVGPQSKVFVVDAQTGHGSDSNPGTSFKAPLATLAKAISLCTANHYDAILLVGGPTANAVSTTAVTLPAYTSLVGMGPANSIGQRCRVTGTATASTGDLANLITFGAGAIVKNIKFSNGSDYAAVTTAATVSGSYCTFENCQFELGHTTALSTSGSNVMALSGSENTYVNCTFGNDTVLWGAANTGANLVMTGGAARNNFIHCRFLSYCETAGKYQVSYADAGSGNERYNEFESCLFTNFSVNYAATLANAFDVPAVAGSSTYAIILRGSDNQLVGIDGWADVPTKVWSPGLKGTSTYGVATAVNT